MIRPGTFWRTVRYLRREQILGRARFRLIRPKPDLQPTPATRERNGEWVTPPAREPSILTDRRVRFLGEERDLREVGWDNPRIAKLWRYNLHYFDDLNALDADARSKFHHAFIRNWISGNQPGRGTGWEPYPTSIRIVNWIKWFIRDPSSAFPEYLHSLAVQARWLSERLEFHLLGNHLFANAKALVFAGSYFEEDEAQAWRDMGMRILERELPEQILADGGHFERSPMYHALALEDVLDLINILRAFDDHQWRPLREKLEATAPGMLRWLSCMSHPNGELAAFNDSASGVAPGVAQLDSYSRRLGLCADAGEEGGDIAHLDSSGYVRVALDHAVALLDVAPVGPDYLPAHAHADTLSFELSIREQRVIVNGGTSCYGAGRQRIRERSTALHSTVEILGQNSSEVWGAFRVGRRARPFDLTVSQDEVCCSHDGYRFLRGRPIHRRCWRFERSTLLVEDTVSVPSLPAVARFLLAPGLRASAVTESRWVIVRDEVAVAVIQVECGIGRVEESTHAPRFGTVLDVDCISVELVQGHALTRIMWKSFH